MSTPKIDLEELESIQSSVGVCIKYCLNEITDIRAGKHDDGLKHLIENPLPEPFKTRLSEWIDIPRIVRATQVALLDPNATFSSPKTVRPKKASKSKRARTSTPKGSAAGGKGRTKARGKGSDGKALLPVDSSKKAPPTVSLPLLQRNGEASLPVPAPVSLLPTATDVSKHKANRNKKRKLNPTTQTSLKPASNGGVM